MLLILCDIAAFFVMLSLIIIGLHVDSSIYRDNITNNWLNIFYILPSWTLTNLFFVSILTAYFGECAKRLSEDNWNRLRMWRNSFFGGIAGLFSQLIVGTIETSVIFNPNAHNYLVLLTIIASATFTGGATNTLNKMGDTLHKRATA